jgi:DNA polymerase-3 subunit delta'
MTNYWTGIAGQETLKLFFDSLLENNSFPQAIIIDGPMGCGKDFIAARFAQLLYLVKQGKDYKQVKPSSQPFTAQWIKYVFALPLGKNEDSHDDPLQKLPEATVRQILDEIKTKNSNPYYAPLIDGANEIKINSIRDIGRSLTLSVAGNLHRTVLISKAEMMNEHAQNALLKNLEEPPEDTTFILTTSNWEALRETIRSRCWTLKAVPLSEEEIVTVLVDSFEVDRNEAEIVAPLSEGSLENAQQLCFRDISSLKELTVSFLRKASVGSLNEAFLEVEKAVLKEGADTVALFLRLILLWLGDAEKSRYNVNKLYFSDFPNVFTDYNKRFSGINLSPVMAKIERFINVIERNNANPSILMHNLLYVIPEILKPRPALQ